MGFGAPSAVYLRLVTGIQEAPASLCPPNAPGVTLLKSHMVAKFLSFWRKSSYKYLTLKRQFKRVLAHTIYLIKRLEKMLALRALLKPSKTLFLCENTETGATKHRENTTWQALRRLHYTRAKIRHGATSRT